MGTFDLVLDFAVKLPEEPDPTTVVTVIMSHSHAKAMLPLITKMIADYEDQWGEIPLHGDGELNV